MRSSAVARTAKVTVSDMPTALEGYEIDRVEVVVRLKRKA